MGGPQSRADRCVSTQDLEMFEAIKGAIDEDQGGRSTSTKEKLRMHQSREEKARDR
jgi:hypothetical protein